MVGRILFLYCILFFANYTMAQTPVLQTLLSKETVEVDDRLTITFRFNASGQKFTPPSNLTENFRVLSGPNQSSEMSFINGSMSSSISYSYILSPINIGTFTIEPARIEFNNEVFQSQKVQIKVVKTDSKKSEPTGESNHEQRQISEAKNNLFLKLEVDKSTVYQGEQIIATYKLFNRARLNGIEGQRMPEFDGFYTSDIEIGNSNHSRETVNGVIYDVFTLKKTILIPQKTGELTLIPLEIDANVQIQDSKPINTWFGPRYQFKNTTISLKSNSQKISVKPLPKNPPKNFSGAVGNFTISSTCTPSELHINEAITYTVKLTGTGNIPLVDFPGQNWPLEFEVYDPKLKSIISNTTNSLSGSKTWEILAIPRNEGEYTLPSISFSYFNLSSKKYETISTSSHPIHVLESANGETSETISEVTKQEIAHLKTDIRYIHTSNSKLKKVDSGFFGSVWFYAWMVIPTFLAILSYFLLLKHSELKADTVGLQRRRATKMAEKLLKTAEKELKNSNTTAFYEAVFKALNGYLSNKFTIATADLNRHFISAKLKETNVNEQTADALLETLNQCEMARFAPNSSIRTHDLLKKAQQIIIKLEEELK